MQEVKHVGNRGKEPIRNPVLMEKVAYSINTNSFSVNSLLPFKTLISYQTTQN